MQVKQQTQHLLTTRTKRNMPGLHATARELLTCTFQGPGASNTTKIPRKDLQERKGRKKIVAREGKKSATFWALHPSGPPLLHELCLPTTEDGRGDGILAYVEQISVSFFWPKSNKHAGLSRIGLSRARPTVCSPSKRSDPPLEVAVQMETTG